MHAAHLARRLRSAFYKIRRLVRRRLHPGARENALEEELEFWREFFKTGGLQWPRDFESRLNPDQPIQEYVAACLERLEGDVVHILDVGSGPVTSLGRKHPSKQIGITATDILASRYDQLLVEVGVAPAVRTIYADAERLSEQFGKDVFNIVHARNSIDHTGDPLRAIEQMMTVARPRGYVVLYHAENEGRKQNYEQLHQWDFTCEDGCFIIADRAGRRTNMTEMLSARGAVECTPLADGAILTRIHKEAAGVGDPTSAAT
jgi:SAM-dependent methyltransferase